MSGWHAKLSASSAERWMNCPGSIREIEQHGKDTTNRYAAEGTVAHDIGAQCLQEGYEPEVFLDQVMTADGFEFTVDQGMLDAVEEYVGFCRGLKDRGIEHDPDTRHWVEHSLTDALVRLYPEFGGTADFVCWMPADKHLFVVDYKHGAGVMVEVENNSQLRYYALGALLSIDQPADNITIVIVQPRCEHEEGAIRRETFAAVDLLDFAGDLIEAAKETEKEDAPLHAGSWCKFCPAAHACPELERQQHQLMEVQFDVVDQLSAQQLGEALDLIPQIEARIAAIRERAYHDALAGHPPPGHKLVEKRKTRKYVDQHSAEIALGHEPAAWDMEPKLKSPAQVEKALGKDRYTALLENPKKPLVEKKSSGYNLVPESHPKPAATLASPEMFDEVFD